MSGQADWKEIAIERGRLILPDPVEITVGRMQLSTNHGTADRRIIIKVIRRDKGFAQPGRTKGVKIRDL